MKVSEAIDQLKIGDEIWAKCEVSATKESTKYPITVKLEHDVFWMRDDDEISLAEPQPEKMEVPDFVAEWYESHKDNLEDAISEQIDHGYDVVFDTRKAFDVWFFDESDCPIETLIRMKDGYTVKPKRWVVKNHDGLVFSGFYGGGFTVLPRFTKEEHCYYKFTDKAKAEAVATLVEGSVEEV